MPSDGTRLGPGLILGPSTLLESAPLGAALYPSSGLYPAADGLYPFGGGPEPPPSISIREKPPMRLSALIETPSGKTFRWGQDAKADSAPGAVTFSSTMPGGFEQLTATFARDPQVDYADLEEFSTITFAGVGDQSTWQGRLETTPRTSGDQMTLAPGAVGWQAHLDDDKTVRIAYLDIDLTHWQPASVGLRLQDEVGGWTPHDATVLPDLTSGFPSLATTITGAWTGKQWSKAFYGQGLPINSVFYAWKKSASIVEADPNWRWVIGAFDDDLQTNPVLTANLSAAGPGMGLAYPAGRTWVAADLEYGLTGTNGTDTIDYTIYWTCLAVIGEHGLTIRGTYDYVAGSFGLYASDVLAHAVQTWAPKLAVSRAGQPTIEASSFIIPHLAFIDQPVSAAEIVRQATRFELQDWWVDEGPTFNLAARGSHGRRWRARVGPSGLSETGPQVDRLYNGVVVSYRDPSGTAQTVGPPGPGRVDVDARLLDSDPQNPVNAAGLDRWALLTVGTMTLAAAVQIGRMWLSEQKVASTAGQARMVGHVEDDHGILWPAWMVRAGDQVSFVDAHDSSWRRIVRAQYTHDMRTCQVDLDSPPDALQALLERMQISLAPLGIWQ